MVHDVSSCSFDYIIGMTPRELLALGIYNKAHTAAWCSWRS